MDISEYEVVSDFYEKFLKAFEATLVTPEYSDDYVEEYCDYKEAFKDLFELVGMLLNKYGEDAHKNNWYEREGKAAIFGTNVIDDE